MNNLPSVTEILSPFVDFSKVPDDRLAYATSRGSRVHSYCAAIAKGLHIPKIDEDCKPYIESFHIFKEQMIEKFIAVEKEFIDFEHQYISHPDLVVVLKDQGPITNFGAVVDLKTPVQESKTWRAQISGYLNVVRKYFDNVMKGGVLQLNPKGGIPKMIWYKEDIRDFHAFLSALNAYRYFK